VSPIASQAVGRLRRRLAPILGSSLGQLPAAGSQLGKRASDLLENGRPILQQHNGGITQRGEAFLNVRD
jgi:hypothetical protein